MRYKGQQIEVATFRADGEYSDGRRPDAVHYTRDPAHDAQRRDFTVNGMFYDPLADQIHDFVGGQQDVAARRIRAIGDPSARFSEDRLRILRAPRFAAVLGFELDPETAAAARAQAPEIASSGVSPERIRVELLKLLRCPGRAAGWRHLGALELLPVVWPAAAAAEVEATARGLEALPRELSGLCEGLPWALPLREVTPAQVGASLEALRCSRKERDGAVALVDALGAARGYAELSVAARKRLLRAEHAPALLALVAADEAARELSEEGSRLLGTDRARWLADKSPAGLAARPLIGGRDLSQAGLRPGPAFARILSQVEDAQLEGRVTDAAQALSLALSIAEQGA